MKNKGTWIFVLFFSGGLLFLLPTLQGKDEEKVQSNASLASQSLIRKDLLIREKKELDRPLRNIFSSRQVGLNLSGSKAGRKNKRAADKEKTSQKDREEGALNLAFNLRYIGYILSPQTIIAIILHEKEAFAVERGDVVSERIEIADITKDMIEFVGPDSNPKKVFLEGEEE